MAKGIYNSGQITALYPFLKVVPDWMLLGGPADSDEAQSLRKVYPQVQILAVEACMELVLWQKANGFPPDALIINRALSNKNWEQLEFSVFKEVPRRSSAVRELEGGPIEKRRVESVTIDFLTTHMGMPVQNGILWLDIEGSELRALQGAVISLEQRCWQVINVEMINDQEETNTQITSLLESFGYRDAHQWDQRSGNHADHIFIRS